MGFQNHLGFLANLGNLARNGVGRETAWWKECGFGIQLTCTVSSSVALSKFLHLLVSFLTPKTEWRSVARVPIVLLTNATRSPLSLRVLSPLPHLRSGDNETLPSVAVGIKWVSM